MFENDTTSHIAEFLKAIGLEITAGAVDESAFLPGIRVENGGLVIDESRLSYPGDLLHEAGHLAVVPLDIRQTLHDEVHVDNPVTIESAAMSWSYAACVHLGLNLRVVFHESGYHGRSENLLLGFQLGVFPGLHELISAGMTRADKFPEMQKWLRD